jgi:class 3 adenylate cyclase
MPAAQARRRLATMLFLDIVGSTELASELGDSRWRELLTRRNGR